MGQSNITLNMILLITFVVVLMAGGILAGIIYFSMDTLQSTLQTVNFTLPYAHVSTMGEPNITNFQDVLGVVVYPLLNLKSALPYLTYFLIFSMVIALGICAYISSKTPVFFVVHALFTIAITYLCIILRNVYVDLLSNTFFNSVMAQFTIYNKIMVNLPQVVFFTSLLFAVISFTNIIKPQSQFDGSAAYQGDY